MRRVFGLLLVLFLLALPGSPEAYAPDAVAITGVELDGFATPPAHPDPVSPLALLGDEVPAPGLAALRVLFLRPARDLPAPGVWQITPPAHAPPMSLMSFVV